MVKYYGDRGCGKTVKLLREAGKAVIDGKTVVFVVFQVAYISTLKDKAIRLFGEELTDKIHFLTPVEAHDFVLQDHKGEDVKVFIDEAEVTLYNILFGLSGVDVTMTLDVSDAIKLNWREN